MYKLYQKSLLFSILIIIVLFTNLPIDAMGGTVGGFTYEVKNDNTVVITACDLNGDVVIPETIAGYQVTSLAAQLFYGSSNVTTVTIPKTVSYFGDDPDDNMWDYVFSYCYNLKKIIVASENPVFCSVDGVLYTKDMKYLINYPAAKEGAEYHVSGKTIHLYCTSFAGAANLRSLYLEDRNITWSTYTFYNDSNLTVFYIPGGYSETRVKLYIERGYVYESDTNFCRFLKSGHSLNIQNSNGTDLTGETIKTLDNTYQLKAINVSNQDSQNFSWSSSDNAIAVVDQTGKVTFKKEGTVIITASDNNESGWVKITYLTSGSCGTNIKYDISGNSINFSKVDSGKDATWSSNCKDIFKESFDITKVNISESIRVSNGRELFRYCQHVKEMNLEKLDVSNVVDMYGMFYGCRSLTSLNISSWNTSNVNNLVSMFYDCSSLNSLDVSSWDVSNVTDMSFMFAYCESLSNIEVNSWNTSNVNNLEVMFCGCSSLMSLDVSNWDVSNVTNMYYLFYGCSSLNGLDVNGWDASNVTDTTSMFQKCSNLKSFTLPSGLETIGNWAFAECDSLTNITIPANITFIEEQAFQGTNPTIHAERNSYAATWAAANNRPLEIYDKVPSTPTPTVTLVPTSTIITPTPTETLAPESTITITETPSPTPAPDETITISGPDSVAVKQSITLTALIGGNLRINNTGVLWSTSNKKIATVESGTVTGKKAGTVEIRACAAANPSVCGSKTVTVIPLAKKVVITDYDDGTNTIDLGTKGTPVEKITYQLSASVSPADAKQDITWSSQNPSIATVDQNGLVTATGTGKVSIIATAADGSNKSKSFKLEVISDIQDGSITITGESLVIQKKKVTLNVSYGQQVLPVKGKLTWSSSDPSIAKVSNKGVVTGVSEGNAVITACSTTDSSACGSFTIHSIGIASSVVINDNDNGSKLIDIGTAGTANEKLTYSLSANILPANVQQNLIWTSSNPDVASVYENGLVTGHAVGSANITATSDDNAHKKAKVTVKVTSNVQPGSLTLSGPDTFDIKETKSLTASFSQLNQPLKNKINWSSSDTAVAKVKNGDVTGISDGSAVITACSKENPAVCAARTVYVGLAAPAAPSVMLASVSAAETGGSGPAADTSFAASAPVPAEEINELPDAERLPEAEPAAEAPLPESKTVTGGLEFAADVLDLHVGESLALAVNNPQMASWLVVLKEDEKDLSYNDNDNTLTGLAEGDTVVYLADRKTVDIVDQVEIHVLSAAEPENQPTPTPTPPADAQNTAVPTEIPAAASPDPVEKPAVTLTPVPENPLSADVIRLEDGNFEMTVNSVKQLSFAQEGIFFGSGDENIAKVGMNSGEITAMNPGTTTVYAASIDPLEVIALADVTVTGAEETTEDPAEEPTAEPTPEVTEESDIEPTAEVTEEMPADPTAEVTEVPPADPTQEVTEEPPADPTQEITEEPPADPTQEVTEELPADPTQEVTEELPADPTQEATEELPADPTQEVTEEPPADPSQEITEEPPADPTQEVTKEPPAEPTQEVTEEPPADPTQEVTEEPPVDPKQEVTEEPPAEPTQEVTEEPPADPTQEITEVPPAEPAWEVTEEPAPVQQIDPYFVSGEYELPVGETLFIQYENPDNIPVYVVLSEGADKVEWDESNLSVTAIEPGDLTILLTTAMPYAVKDVCLVHIPEPPEEELIDRFKEEEISLPAGELLILNDLLKVGTREDYEVEIRGDVDSLIWDEEWGTILAFGTGKAELILHHPGSETDLDVLLIRINTEPVPTGIQAEIPAEIPAETPAPDPVKDPDPSEKTDNSPE